MKTRSNDIIPNAPFKYNSDTNTLEIGTNLYVDGVIDTTQIQMSDDGAAISFNLEDNKFSFQDKYGNITSLVVKDTSEILTDKSVKTLFGNQSIYGSGNIDLYRHQLTLFNRADEQYILIVYSSSNLNVDSVTDLTTLTKANDNYKINVIKVSDGTSSLLKYDGSIWILSDGSNILSVSDIVTTI